jgi:YVTN family beta-propeller protein
MNPAVEAIDAEGADAANAEDAPTGGIGLKQEKCMNLRICRLLAIGAFVSCFFASAQTLAQTAAITNSTSGRLALVDTQTDRIFGNFFIGEGGVGVAVSPDGSRVFIGHHDFGRVSVFNALTLSLLADIPVGRGPLGLASQDRNKVYVANQNTGTVSVITATDAVTYKLTATIDIGREPRGVAVSPDGRKLYVTFHDNVSVIDAATNDQNLIFDGGHRPVGVAVSPDGSKFYVANEGSDTVSALATATNAVIATIPVGRRPFGVAVSPDDSKVYVTNTGSDDVSVIAAATSTVTATIPVRHSPKGVAVTPDGSKVYVVNEVSGSVSVIATATNTVIPTGTRLIGLERPVSFGVFIGPAQQRFTGTPGFSNCEGQSVAALDRQFRGRNAAAAALGFPDVRTLENAILAFCR